MLDRKRRIPQHPRQAAVALPEELQKPKRPPRPITQKNPKVKVVPAEEEPPETNDRRKILHRNAIKGA